MAPKCSSLKQELKSLRHEADDDEDSDKSKKRKGPGGLSNAQRRDQGLPLPRPAVPTVHVDARKSDMGLAIATDDTVTSSGGVEDEESIISPPCYSNRFQAISDENCDLYKQSAIKKVAKSPATVGEPSSSNSAAPPGAHHGSTHQKYSHILVVDFECTCDSGEPHYPHEIIEFPVVVIDTRRRQVVAEFHTYVKPVRNPQLTEFCTALTGIRQDQVDGAPTIGEALDMFRQWLRDVFLPLAVAASSVSRNAKNDGQGSLEDSDVCNKAEIDRLFAVLNGSSSSAPPQGGSVKDATQPSFIFATDGPSDMRTFVYDCHVIRDGIDFPPMFYRWLNVRRAFADHFRVKPETLLKMLRRLGMQFHGQHHSGIDDARNIARVVLALVQRGHRLQHVSSIPVQSSEMLACDRRASNLLEELGDDNDIGIRKRTNNNPGSGGKHASSGRKKKK